MNCTKNPLAAFQVPLGHHVLSLIRQRSRGLWRSLGNLESHALRGDLDGIRVNKPIYIAGLARSGSTMLLEIVASHSSVVTHQYRDFWTIFTPYWSQQKSERRNFRKTAPVERSHGDGLMVTADSPEAMEEILWMAFFNGLHDWRSSNILDAHTENPAFEAFYRDHIRKLLLVRGGCRYAAKGNYNLARANYLLKLFPDARFLVPVRHPRFHVASLEKQHALFSRAAAHYPRSVAYLDQVGHYEFGAHRRPLNHGNNDRVRSIVELWDDGEAARGWARYWSHAYGAFFQQLQQHPQLQRAVLLLRYEDLCDQPRQTLAKIIEHCGLDGEGELIDRFAGELHAPTYYEPKFTDAEESAIREETEEVAAWYGYDRNGVAKQERQCISC